MRLLPPLHLPAMCLSAIVLIGQFPLGTNLAIASTTTVELDRPAYFEGSTGQDIRVEQGNYIIEGTEDSLILLPTKGDNPPALLLKAHQELHNETIVGPVALFLSPADDVVILGILTPDGTGMTATGSFSGTRSRAISNIQVGSSLQAALQNPGAPNPPDLLNPEDGVTFQASSTSTSAFTQFRWKRAAGGVAPQFYRLFLEDADNPAGFKTGIVEISHADPTVYTTQPISPYLFDKRVRWSVSACTRGGVSVTGTALTFCSRPSSRIFTWGIARPRPPILAQPVAGVATTPDNVVFTWQEIRNASSYLLCVSKPGIACPDSAVENANTIVTKRVGNQATSGQITDLSRFVGQTVNWTVASCDSDNRCTYQPAVHPLTVVAAFPMRLVIDELRAFSVTRNEASLGEPRADEVYLFISAASKSQNRLTDACSLSTLTDPSNIPNTPGCERFPKGTPDYYGLHAGNAIQAPITVWQGNLGKGDASEVSVIVGEQDNAQRERVIRAGLAAVAASGSGLASLLGKTGEASIFSRDAMIEGGQALFGLGNALAQAGDDILGGMMVVLKNEGQRVSVNFIPKSGGQSSSDTLMLPLGENAFSQTFLMVGGGAVYQIKFRVEPIGITLPGISYLTRAAPPTGPTIPVQLIVEELKLNRITSEKAIPLVGSNTADEIYFETAGAVHNLGSAPQYSARRTPPRGAAPRDIIEFEAGKFERLVNQPVWSGTLSPGGTALINLAVGEQESPLKAIDIESAVSGVGNLVVGAAAFVSGQLTNSAMAGAEGLLSMHNVAVQLVNGITTNQDEVVGAISILLRNNGSGRLGFESYPLASLAREEARMIDSRTIRLTGAGGDYTLKLRLVATGGGITVHPIPTTP